MHERNTPEVGAVVRRSLAVVGASAGGVEALTALARGLPADLPLAVIVVLHLPSSADSRLPAILGRAGPVPAVFAEPGMEPESGRIYVAPPDRHLVVSGGRMALLDGPRENGFRPAVDPLFRSVARDLGPRAVGIILSGTMDDGAVGMAAIQSFGGATIVQDPAEALATGMPEAAMELIEPDHVVSAAAIGPLLQRLAQEDIPAPVAAPRPVLVSVGPGGVPAGDPSLVADPMELEPHGVDLSCPECGGALQGLLAGRLTRFRCRTGHIYSPRTLLDTKSVELEAALWAAIRALEEEASIAGRLAARALESGAAAAARRFESRRGDAVQRAGLIRDALVATRPSGTEDEAVVLTQPGVVRA